MQITQVERTLISKVQKLCSFITKSASSSITTFPCEPRVLVVYSTSNDIRKTRWWCKNGSACISQSKYANYISNGSIYIEKLLMLLCIDYTARTNVRWTVVEMFIRGWLAIGRINPVEVNGRCGEPWIEWISVKGSYDVVYQKFGSYVRGWLSRTKICVFNVWVSLQHGLWLPKIRPQQEHSR